MSVKIYFPCSGKTVSAELLYFAIACVYGDEGVGVGVGVGRTFSWC